MKLHLRINKTIPAGKKAIRRNCNLDCIWCHSDYFEHSDIPAIDNETIVKITKRVINTSNATDVYVRIAGNGEPTLVGADELGELIKFLKQIPHVHQVGLTTNGVLISQMLSQLEEAGLDRITISLNTLCRDTYLKYMQRDHLAQVLESIEMAYHYGIPLKINTIYGRFNQNEIHDFEQLSSKYHGMPIKFFDLITTNEATRREYLPLESLEQRLVKAGAAVTEQLLPYAKRTYSLPSGALFEVKIAGQVNTCPNTLCRARANCLEGCRSAVRIGSDGLMAPCGVRHDNRVNLLDANIDSGAIRKALQSGGKLA